MKRKQTTIGEEARKVLQGLTLRVRRPNEPPLHPEVITDAPRKTTQAVRPK